MRTSVSLGSSQAQGRGSAPLRTLDWPNPLLGIMPITIRVHIVYQAQGSIQTALIHVLLHPRPLETFCAYIHLTSISYQ